MPRRRPDAFEIRGKQLQQEQRDRQQRQAILASQAAAATQATPEPALPPPAAEATPEATSEAPEWDPEAWQLNCRVTSLMASKFGASWHTSPRLSKVAERALADLKGAGDGAALRHLRHSTGNGSYPAALALKYGD